MNVVCIELKSIIFMSHLSLKQTMYKGQKKTMNTSFKKEILCEGPS